MKKTALILGASGLAGRHAATAFAQAGWEVTRFKRGTDMTQAAQGADIIFNGMNPSGYRDWETALPAITRDVIAAAKASGARVILPGNVYNFGTEPAPWGPRTPQNPNTSKGEIRRDIETSYRESGIRILILRAGDFIAKDGDGAWWEMAIAGPLRKGKLSYPGPMDRQHAWCYLPDFARAAVALSEGEDRLDDFADIPFASLNVTGDEIAVAARAVHGKVVQKRFSWWALRLAGPFWATAREVLKMRYLWTHPHGLDPAPMMALLPSFEPTSLEQVIANTSKIDVDPDKTVVRADGTAIAN